MDSKEERELMMVDSTVECVEAYDTSDAPVIAEKVSEIKTKAAKIRTAEKELKKDTTGFAKSKNLTRKKVTADVMIIAGGVYVCGFTKNDENLKTVGGIFESVLLNASDAQFPILCKNILDTAKTIPATELEHTGVTQEMITETEVEVNVFSASKAKVGGVRVTKGGARDLQDSLFEEINERLEILDRLMRRYETRNLDLYNQYQIARKVIDAPTHHRDTKPEEPVDDQTPENGEQEG